MILRFAGIRMLAAGLEVFVNGVSSICKILVVARKGSGSPDL